MKRLFTILAASLALLLAGCAGFDSGALVDVTESLTGENTSTAKGATAGMSSSDAANVLMNRDYYNAIKAVAGADKVARAPLVEVEAHDGKPITIDAKVFRVFAPPTQQAFSAGLGLQRPVTLESNGIKWFREIKEATIGTLQTVLPWKMVREEGKTRRHESDNSRDVRLGELEIMGAAVTGSQGIAGQAIQNFRPVVVTVPAAAPAASTEPAPTTD